jgi:hypothetical protein
VRPSRHAVGTVLLCAAFVCGTALVGIDAPRYMAIIIATLLVLVGLHLRRSG